MTTRPILLERLPAAMPKFLLAAGGRPVHYLAALALTAVALGGRFLLAPYTEGIPFVTFMPSAALAAICGGFYPGMFAAVLGAVLADYFFIPPYFSVEISWRATPPTLVYLSGTFFVSLAAAAMHRYYRAYVTTAMELEKARAAEREARLAAERANDAKSRFLAAASHDLRQPYQALRLFHSALKENNRNPRLTELLDHMDVAMTAGENLLQSLLHVSTLDAGIVRPRPEPVRAASLLSGVAARHRPSAREKGLALRLRARDITLFTDPILLDRLLDNLVANAIRYTREGGVLLACRPREGMVSFEVWDTGIGIAPKYRDTVFEPFFQVDNLERDRAKGVGLGLAVVKKTADLLGGQVDMCSHPGRGTRMTVRVPLRLDAGRDSATSRHART